jgi:hypothetical protein
MKKNTSKRLTLTDNDGNELRHTKLKLHELTQYYVNFFNKESAEALYPWIGVARTLNNPITTKEVAYAASKLKNHRAKGPDNINGELLKHGGILLLREIATLFNQIFEINQGICELKSTCFH